MFISTLKVIQNIGRLDGYFHNTVISLKLNIIIKFEQLEMFSNIRIHQKQIFLFLQIQDKFLSSSIWKLFIGLLFSSMFYLNHCLRIQHVHDVMFANIWQQFSFHSYIELGIFFFPSFISIVILHYLIDMTNEWSGLMIIDEIEYQKKNNLNKKKIFI